MNVFKGKSSQSSEKNPKWVRAITASPFCGLSITSGARFLLLSVGQVVWMLHVLQLSSSSWWSIEWLCLLGRCFPKATLGAACGSQHSSMSHSRFAVCLSTHTTNTPTPPHWQGRRVFFLFLHRSCWLTLLPWLSGLSPGMDPEQTAQVASPTLAVFKHILSPAGQQIPRVWGRMKL